MTCQVPLNCFVTLVAVAGCSFAALAQISQTCAPVVKPAPNLNYKAIASAPILSDVVRWDPDGPFGAIPERILLAGLLTSPTNNTNNEMISAYDPVAGTWTAVGGGFRPGSGQANAAAVMPNGDVIVEGVFSQIGGTPGGGPLVNANRIARWDGTQWHAMGSGIQTVSGFGVFDMAATPSGELIIVGAQLGAGGVASRYVTRWTGTQWVAMNNGLNIDVSSSVARKVAVNANGEVFMAGDLTAMGNIVRWDGTQWQSMGAGLSNVLAITFDPIDQRPIVAASNITGLPPAQQSGVAKWNGSAWQPLGNAIINVADVAIVGGSRIVAIVGTQVFELNRDTGDWVVLNNAPVIPYARLLGLPDGDAILATSQGPSQLLYRFGPQADCPLIATDFSVVAANTANWDLINRSGTWQQEVDTSASGKIQPTQEAATRIVNQEPIYYNATGTWQGDRTAAFGGYMRVETSGLQTACANPGESASHYDVKLIGQVAQGVTRTLVRRTADFATMRDRRVIHVPLTADGWRVDSTSGATVTAQEFYDTLKDVRSLQLSVNAPGPLCQTLNFAIEDIAIYKQAQAITSFNWNQSDYDWRWTGDGDTTAISVENEAPADGSLKSLESASGPWRSFVAPQTFLDGLRNRYGGLISYKLRTTSTADNLTLPVVRIEARDVGTLLYYEPNPPATTFTPYFVSLTATPFDANGRGWVVENFAPALTEAFFRRVLDNATAVKIRGEFSQVNDTTWLDDVAISTTFSNPGCDDIDFNNNTVFPEDQDVIDFFNVLAGGDCSAGNTCNDIDFNNNTVFPEDADVIDFFNVLAGGECV